QPVGHLRQAGAAVLENPMSNDLVAVAGQHHIVLVTRPINARKPLSSGRVGHMALAPFSCQAIAIPVGPCTGARRRGLPTGHRSLPIRRGTAPEEVLEARG